MSNSRPNTTGLALPEYSAIRQYLEAAVREALTRDWDLVANGSHEQAVSHRIAVYLEKHFPEFSTDCEYNRREYKTKSFTNVLGEEQEMRPDIVVHHRINPVNILAVEVKANGNPDSPNDPAKLKALLLQQEYRYKAAAFVRIKNATRDIREGLLSAEIIWYEVTHTMDVVEVGESAFIVIDCIKQAVLEIYAKRQRVHRQN